MSTQPPQQTYLGAVIAILRADPHDSTDAVRAAFRKRLATALANVPAEKRVASVTPDGGFVAFEGDPQEALFSAFEIRKTIPGDGDMPIRIAINLGLVKSSKSDDGKVLLSGEGVDTAARIATAAAPGQILSSKAYQDAVGRISPHHAAYFRSGEPSPDPSAVVIEENPPAVESAPPAAAAQGASSAARGARLWVGALVILGLAAIAAWLLWRAASPDPAASSEARRPAASAPSPAPNVAPAPIAPPMASAPAPVPAAPADPPKPAPAPPAAVAPPAPAAATAPAPAPASPPASPPRPAADGARKPASAPRSAPPKQTAPPAGAPKRTEPVDPAPARPRTPTYDTAPNTRPAPEPPPVAVLHREEPRFPKSALDEGISEGRVRARLAIDGEGRVKDVTILESRPGRVFDREARRALTQWRFNAGADGRAHEVEITFRR